MSRSASRELGLVLRRVFAYQRQQAGGGKTRFGDQHARFAREIELPLARLYLAGLKAAKGDPSLSEDFAAEARERALAVARSVNETSRTRLEGDSSAADVFSDDRAASIALTEESNAINAARALVARSRGGMLVWRTGPGTSCPDCISLNGKKVRAGRSFVARSGASAKHAPLHPNCNCRTEEV